MKALSFEGSGAEYFKIWIVNATLTILTLGLYYPWAKVRNKRYFYANTSLENRNFEYHATGMQLFIGFLITMLFFIAYIFISRAYPLGGFATFGVLFLAIPWLIWRSLKFSLRMTSYSNVRFAFEGKLKDAYMNFFVYPLIFLLALYAVPATVFLLETNTEGDIPSWLTSILPIVMIIGFLFAFYMYAVIKKKNTTYTINGSRYGQSKFVTDVKTITFVMIMLRAVGMVIVVMTAVLVGLGIILGITIGLDALIAIKDAASEPEFMQDKMGEILPIISLIYLGLILGGIAVIAYIVTRQRAYIYENTILDDKITFASTLKARAFTWVLISNFLLILVTLGLAFPWAKVRMARLMLENTLVNTEASLYDYITQKQNEESSLGEQLGDAFDVDVQLGL